MAREMKDSGIEWIGEIPAEWKVTKVLNGLIMPITDGPHTTPDLFDKGIPFISAEAVSSGNGKIDFSHMRGFISEEFYQECCKKYIPKINDIYMIKSGATTGKVSIVDSTETLFTIWSPLAVFRCDLEKLIPKFLFYQLQSDGFQKQVELGWSFGTQQNIGMRSLEKLTITIPPIEEQKCIANHLDSECAYIDSIIEQTRASIEEYKKLKQAVITQAVTKGIRPDRPMKDSGFDWMGKIPLDWSVQKTKAFSKRIVVGVVIKPADYFDENGTVPFLRGINVKEYIINPNPMVYISEETNKLLSKSVVHTDDLLIVRDGSIGTACVVPPEYNGANVVSMIIVSCEQTVVPKYLCYSFNSDVGRTQFDLTKIGTALTHTSVQSVSNIFHALPSYEEQLEIVEHIDGKVKEINVLIEKKTRLLSDLETYKKSLIYEYVTGKKEVPA